MPGQPDCNRGFSAAELMQKRAAEDAEKAIYLGEIEAADEREALRNGTEKFDADAAKLIAAQRQ